MSLVLYADVLRAHGQAGHPGLRRRRRRHRPLVSGRGPVHPDDPITGSREALEALRNAASGGGAIDSENLVIVETKAKHLPPEDIKANLYPFIGTLEDEAADARTMVMEFLGRCGLPAGGRPAAQPSRPVSRPASRRAPPPANGGDAAWGAES